VLGELNSTISFLEYQAERETTTLVQTVSMLPENFAGQNTGAEILVAPSGKLLYASNRGHDSLVIYAINQANGQLTLIGHQSTLGKSPRHFTFDSKGKFLVVANQDSDSLAVFELDQSSGSLTSLGDPIPSPTPVCIQFT
jgi:6-phosphogluconolactonase